jgi:hypothetical protein
MMLRHWGDGMACPSDSRTQGIGKPAREKIAPNGKDLDALEQKISKTI